MKNMTVPAISEVVAGMVYPGSQTQPFVEITAVVTDSRQVTKGCLFVALRGEHVDGHQFLDQAAADGAMALLVEEEPKKTYPATVIRVEDAMTALQKLAAYYLQQLHIPTVGIIGSAGKTSTKEMVASVLSEAYRVGKTEGNLNNELGVPLTIFSLTEAEEIAVIEMGINHFGEMTRLGEMVHPDTVVMTNIGTAHLEFLGSRDGILQAKSEIFAQMQAEGHVVCNDDDDKLATIDQIQGKEPVRFGIESERAAVRAEDLSYRGLHGVHCWIRMPEQRLEVQIPSPGRFSVYNALAAAAVGTLYGVSSEGIQTGIAKAKRLAGRFHTIQTERFMLIDDCYNANPASMRASLEVFAQETGRRVAILGDMGELGEDSQRFHQEICNYAASLALDVICLVGPEFARCTLPKALFFSSKEELVPALDEICREGDCILLKASHYMGFSDLVTALQELKNEKKELPKSP